jgi:protein TonB
VAFEAYRTQGLGGSQKSRRVTYTLSAVVHGALIAVGVIYSFWHVDELTPPTLRVTFMSAAAPPPPPPPPPPAGGPARKKVATKPRLTPTPIPTPVLKPNDIVQPRERPDPVKKPPRPRDDEEDDEDEPVGVAGGVKGGTIGGTVGGIIGGVKGGVIGGVVGGTGAAPVASKFLPPNLGALQKVSGSDPPFPMSLRRGGNLYVVMAKICVGKDGAVDSVSLMKRADPLLDDSVVSTVKGWRYRPLMANSTAVPFCYFGRFEFKSQ